MVLVICMINLTYSFNYIHYFQIKKYLLSVIYYIQICEHNFIIINVIKSSEKK